LSRICSDLPHQVLGCWVLPPSALGFLYERFSSLLGNEACLFRNQQAERWLSGNHGSL